MGRADPVKKKVHSAAPPEVQGSCWVGAVQMAPCNQEIIYEGQSRASLCGVFCAKGTGDPQMVIGGEASRGQSSVPISTVLRDVPSAPYLAINEGELASSGRTIATQSLGSLEALVGLKEPMPWF